MPYSFTPDFEFTGDCLTCGDDVEIGVEVDEIAQYAECENGHEQDVNGSIERLAQGWLRGQAEAAREADIDRMIDERRDER